MGTGCGDGCRSVFLDRDGVINSNVLNPATGEMESPLTAGQFCFLPGALAAMLALRRAGYQLFLVSNQPNYAKGKASLEELEAIHQRLLEGLAEAGVEFAAFYYCLHHPDGVMPGYSGLCKCRKPSSYFLEQAIAAFRVDRERSWMIGDRWSDVECGQRAGVSTILIGETPGTESVDASALAPDLASAVRLILQGRQQVRR